MLMPRGLIYSSYKVEQIMYTAYPEMLAVVKFGGYKCIQQNCQIFPILLSQDFDLRVITSILFSGEFLLHLHHLEQSFFQALNEVKGRIRDNDR